MRDIPLEVYLSFPFPNYTNPKTRGPALTIINGILLFFVSLALVLRIYTRVVIKRSLGFDDYSIIVGFIFTVGLVAAVILANDRYFWYTHTS
jgi:hypothetical protein